MPKDESNFQFVVDTDPDDPGEYAEDYEAQDAMFEAMEGKASVTQEAFTDEWGTFYSGYAPIVQNGKTLGIVAVDYEASSIRISLNYLIRNILFSVAIGILFAVIAAVILAVRMRCNFRKVNDKILEVVSDDGDLTKVLDITSGKALKRYRNICYKSSNTKVATVTKKGVIKAKAKGAGIGRYLFATENATYVIMYATDVQYDPADKEQESTYQKMMSEIRDIQFVANNIFENITDNAIPIYGIFQHHHYTMAFNFLQ
ncbi:MAG: hypothetical protein K2I10_08070 [Lachnospiraceae bacterium]|nr:hypothetical protein [Lachnospiraceae bacterium]